MTPGFWKRRRVFVTGHTGFKGSWLCLWLQSLGAEVTGFALAPDTEPNLFELARVADGMVSIAGDVRDPGALERACRQADPEVAFHLAAQPLVRESYRQPAMTYATNVMGTVHFLEALRAVPACRAAVVVTTDKCYESQEWPWGYREDDALGGHDPYASSKACAELVALAYRRSFFSAAGPRLATARAGNVIGGGDWAPDRLVPDVLRAFARGRPAQIRNPRSVRPWQHVLGPLSGYLLLAEHLWDDARYAEAWNFGPADHETRPVSWIADRLAARWGDPACWETLSSQGRDPADDPHETRALRLDCAKARELLGWRQPVSLDTALDWTVDWHRQQLAGADMRATCSREIGQISEVAF